MGASVRIGRLAGIDIGLHWSLAIVFVLIVWTLASQVFPAVVPDQSQTDYWLTSVVAALLFYASLLSHEMGHALVARRLGVRVAGITLWIFGGVARLSGDMTTPGTEATIAIAGPVVSLAVAVAFGAATYVLDLRGGPQLVAGAGYWLAFSNATLLVFNFIPAFPLDGGRLLRAWLWRRIGDRYRATARAAWLGRASGLLMIGLGLLALLFQGAISGLWLVLVGWFLISAARGEESHLLVVDALAGLRVGDVMKRDPTVAPGWITVEEFMRSYLPGQRSIAYPLKTFDGALDGLVTISRLAQVPLDARHSTRVRDVGSGMEEVGQASSGEPVAAVLDRFGLSEEGQVLVIDGGKLVGMLSPTDVTRAMAGRAPRAS